MTYCTLQQARRQLATTLTDDDPVLADSLASASQAIADECGYSFEEQYLTYGFNGEIPYYDPLLNLNDRPLISIDSFTNGDGTALAAADYTALPIGQYPKKEVRLTAGTYFTTPDTWPYVRSYVYAVDAIQIAGRWSYNRKGPSAWKDSGLTVSGAHTAATTTLTMSAVGAAVIDVGSYLKIVDGAGAIEYLTVTGPVTASTADSTTKAPNFTSASPTVLRGEGGSTALAFAGGEKIYVYQVEPTIVWACAEVVAAAYKSRDNATGSAFNPGGFGTITIADLPDKVRKKLQWPYRSFVWGRPLD